MNATPTRTLGTCVYVRREGERGPEVLMMFRHKEPNLGLWVAPGGKVEMDESPRECALRELHEETGLVGRHALFRGLVTEISPLQHWQWLLFIYVVTEFEGEVRPDLREGRLRWIPVADLPTLPIPLSDASLWPCRARPRCAFLRGDDDLRRDTRAGGEALNG